MRCAYMRIEVCTGYPGPRIIPGLKTPGTKNPGILISEISGDKKSRDFCYLKIPGYFDNIIKIYAKIELTFFCSRDNPGIKKSRDQKSQDFHFPKTPGLKNPGIFRTEKWRDQKIPGLKFFKNLRNKKFQKSCSLHSSNSSQNRCQ